MTAAHIDVGATVTVTNPQAVASAYRRLIGVPARDTSLVDMLVDLAHHALKQIPGVDSVDSLDGARTMDNSR